MRVIPIGVKLLPLSQRNVQGSFPKLHKTVKKQDIEPSLHHVSMMEHHFFFLSFKQTICMGTQITQFTSS